MHCGGGGGVGVGGGGGGVGVGGVGGGGGGGEEEPSTLRVEKEGMFGLAIAITWRLPDSGGGEGRRQRGRGVGRPASAMEAWWAAARWFRRALALAPRWRRRFPGAGCKDGVPVDVEGGGEDEVEVDSRCSLATETPPFVEKVRVTVAPASSRSSKTLMSFSNSAFIFAPDIWS